MAYSETVTLKSGRKVLHHYETTRIYKVGDTLTNLDPVKNYRVVGADHPIYQVVVERKDG